jgi:L-2-aminoadipate reductase
VVIEKAGVLSPTVKEFISQHLSLKAFVPSLAIQTNGTLKGHEEENIFQEQILLKQNPPKIVVGPDSTPTLSFTSGSEGVPKGVRGRHFSLTYYFPWMAKTFGLSEKDHFTMLSGIAHDPIQRDSIISSTQYVTDDILVFTPLFLGASLFVPTADDIGTPGRLAEWMAKVGATVTHLTPGTYLQPLILMLIAMGQLLSTEATATIPTLHNAFFVGDVLTKRDCLRLQSLAANVRIINMYGTTETQRAVSYFSIPPASTDPVFLTGQKDVIPAGRGMIDVQLLVVNRTDKNLLCGVGEIGDLYVRAAGLAEGYLQLPDLTKEKFVPNWLTTPNPVQMEHAQEEWHKYYFGPRDRLYRTGDLGRYTPSGDGKYSCTPQSLMI